MTTPKKRRKKGEKFDVNVEDLSSDSAVHVSRQSNREFKNRQGGLWKVVAEMQFSDNRMNNLRLDYHSVLQNFKMRKRKDGNSSLLQGKWSSVSKTFYAKSSLLSFSFDRRLFQSQCIDSHWTPPTTLDRIFKIQYPWMYLDEMRLSYEGHEKSQVSMTSNERHQYDSWVDNNDLSVTFIARRSPEIYRQVMEHIKPKKICLACSKWLVFPDNFQKEILDTAKTIIQTRGHFNIRDLLQEWVVGTWNHKVSKLEEHYVKPEMLSSYVSCYVSGLPCLSDFCA